jgi:hypothetical protein
MASPYQFFVQVGITSLIEDKIRYVSFTTEIKSKRAVLKYYPQLFIPLITRASLNIHSC